CVIERMREKCCVKLDNRGCSSLILIPGTFEAIGLYGPRISSGAPGLRSQVSMWLGPPQSRTKMHDRSAAPRDSPRPVSTLAATVPCTGRHAGPHAPLHTRQQAGPRLRLAPDLKARVGKFGLGEGRETCGREVSAGSGDPRRAPEECKGVRHRIPKGFGA